MYHEKMNAIISLVLNKQVSKDFILEYLSNNFSPTKIYDSDDSLITDAYFSLLHYAWDEEQILNEEWEYFIKCFNGECVHNFDEKNAMLHECLEKYKS